MVFFEGAGEIVVVAEMEQGGNLADAQVTPGQQPGGTLHFSGARSFISQRLVHAFIRVP